MKNRILISGNLNKRDEGLIFENFSKAVNYLQSNNYSDYEISLVRFVPYKCRTDTEIINHKEKE
ncbi:MAG TPA: hypothetical protein DER56_03005 [Thermosipho africanus]|nr:hypothetical protein [Thermosipho africanus]